MNGSQDPQQGRPEQTGAPYSAPRPSDSPWLRNISDLGVDPRLAGDPRRKSPTLAAMLSLMPGLGQVYVGYYQQGFINIVVVGGIIALLADARHGIVHNLIPLLALFMAFYWLYNMVDAARRAMFYNQSLAGLGPVEIPEDMKLPKGGSLAGGIALIAIGLVFFANTALGMSLDWLEQWWPMGLVLLGLYLVYGSVTARRTREAPRERVEEPSERS
jgi:TM2 domain-containing membrane protein YozV